MAWTKEKQAAYMIEYRKRNAEKLRKWAREYRPHIYQKHRLKELARAKAKRQGNLEVSRKREREYRRRNAEYYREYMRAYWQRNKDKLCDYASRRRAAERNSKIDTQGLKEFYLWLRTAADVTCFYCNSLIPSGKRTADHKTPLCRGTLILDGREGLPLPPGDAANTG
jgi:hypothetical protein